MNKGFFTSADITQATAPISTVPKCGACGLYQTCHSPKIPIYGNGARKILIIGEAPGTEEDQRGIPFVGQAGQLLRETLTRLGVDLKRDCWSTNALICRPPKNRKPKDKEILHCSPNIFNAIRQLNPITIIPLGQIAVKSILSRLWKEGVDAITRWVGYNIPAESIDTWICPNYHPSYVLRDNKGIAELWFRRYLKAAIQHKERPGNKGSFERHKKSVEIIYNPDDAARIIRKFNRRRYTSAFDFETNCLRPETPGAEIWSCAICWGGKRTIAYPWVGEAIEATKEYLFNAHPKIAATKFEDRWTRKLFGQGIRNWIWCTVTGAHIENYRRKTTSVKFQSFVKLGQPSYNDHIESYLKSGKDNPINRIHEIDWSDLLLYNGLDALFEYLIGLPQIESMKRDHENFAFDCV